jgi:hypothetical protein
MARDFRDRPAGCVCSPVTQNRSTIEGAYNSYKPEAPASVFLEKLLGTCRHIWLLWEPVPKRGLRQGSGVVTLTLSQWREYSL